jgi:6-pyruvoyl-tetrahydropterin synthase
MEDQLSPTEENLAVGTLFVKDVDRLDCAVFDPSLGVVGQSWYVDIEVTGQLDENGFVYDFSHLKKLVKLVLKQSLDHALLIPIQSTHVRYQESESGEIWYLKAKGRLTGANSEWVYACPKGAVYPIRSVKVTESLIEAECTRLIRHRLNSGIQKVAVKFRPEIGEATDSFFRYTHGISGHQGLCQRLFHGHRSRVEVFVGGERRRDIEQYIAHDLFNSIVHIASKTQLVDAPKHYVLSGPEDETINLAFEGTLGSYEASIPKNRIYWVEDHTSIECISQALAAHIAERLNHSCEVKVFCFEGIDKGAFAIV